MPLDFVATSFILAAFLLVYGGFLFWLATKIPEKVGWWPLEKTVQANAFMFILMALIAASGAIGYSVEQVVTPPCENVVNESEEVNNTLVFYTYTNSCAGQTAPPIVPRIMYIYLIGVFLVFFQVWWFLFYLSLKWVMDRW